ncbi:hypothetical protein C5S30_07560 [ANME-1 cluster archaeon GoMg4]|nr:hypothetical protein [ANME-1 cluster archaeon GoMg4]
MKIAGYKAEEQAGGVIETTADADIRKEIERKKEKSFYFITFGLIFYALYPTISVPPENVVLGAALVLFLLGAGCMAFAIFYTFWLARKMCSSGW